MSPKKGTGEGSADSGLSPVESGDDGIRNSRGEARERRTPRPCLRSGRPLIRRPGFVLRRPSRRRSRSRGDLPRQLPRMPEQGGRDEVLPERRRLPSTSAAERGDCTTDEEEDQQVANRGSRYSGRPGEGELRVDLRVQIAQARLDDLLAGSVPSEVERSLGVLGLGRDWYREDQAVDRVPRWVRGDLLQERPEQVVGRVPRTGESTHRRATTRSEQMDHELLEEVDGWPSLLAGDQGWDYIPPSYHDRDYLPAWLRELLRRNDERWSYLRH